MKKNLRSLIVEKLNHFENQEKVVSALLGRKNSKSSPRTANKKHTMKPQQFKISPTILSQTFLDKIPTLTTSKILQNMTVDSKNLAEKFWRTASVFYETDGVKKTIPKLINYRHPLSNNKTLNLTQKLINSENEKAYLYPTTNEEKFAISEELKEIFNWTANREKDFQKSRGDAKTKYVKNINVSNWYELAFLPMVQEIHLDFKKLKQRDIKLQKFGEGEALSSEDLKFIVDTSDLLNSCVDRGFLQEAINIIDDEVIRNLELYLAENILMNYEEIKSVIKESRLRFLEEKNRLFDEKNEKRRIKTEREKKIEDNKKESKKNINMFKKIWERLGNGIVARKKEDNNKKDIGMKKEVVRRTYHPPSKVMTTSSYERNDVDEEKGFFCLTFFR